MRIVTLASLFLLTSTLPAMADCFDVIGCTDHDRFRKAGLREMSCQLLWDIRNRIYKDNGYCFATERAIEYFGNDGCYIRNQSSVRLNKYERNNVTVIKAVENEKGC